MLKSQVFIFVFAILAGCGDISIHGASLGDLEQQQVSIQDLKEYIQPIIYQKLLQAPQDSAVVQQAKTLVSEYLVDTLLDSAQNPEDSDNIRPEHFARQATSNGTGSRPGISITIGGSQGISIGRNNTTPSPQHVINQVDRILESVNGGNISGIVDQALRIRAPAPVQQLVNGIMNLVLCNPFNRLWNRCYGGGSLLFGARR